MVRLPRILVIVLFGTTLAAAENRIRRAVDSRTVTLRNHFVPSVRAQSDLGPVLSSTSINYATLRLKPAAGLEQFLADQRNPSSPDYHRWLTPEQFAERFGVSSDDLAKIVSWLQAQGLQVHDVARGHHWITFSGTVERMNRAFHTTIHRYQVNGETHFAPATDLAVPLAFEDVVSGVDGLDDSNLRPLLQLETSRREPFSSQFTTGGSRYLAPDDFATVYNVTPLYNAGFDGTGQKIAVIGRSAIDLANVRRFRQAFSLPPNDPQLVLFGPDPGITSSVIESDLDLEWAGAVARHATLLYVYASSVITAAQYAIDRNLAPVITFSYGGCEAYNSPALRAVAQQANAQGITWVSASGDWGAATCDLSAPTPQASKGPMATFPASIPEITAVGGTEFDDDTVTQYWAQSNTVNGSSALSYVPERAWNDTGDRNDLSASGGGPSTLFSKPAWQSGAGVPSDNARDTPDVAFAASPQHYAYIIYSGGSLVHVGGTSVASPAFAGMLALLNHYLVANGIQTQPGLGNINPKLYRLAQAGTHIFHDITTGNNFVPCTQGSPGCAASGMGFAAGPGYDLATGLGSVDAYSLVTGWKTGTSTNTTLTVSPAAVALSDVVQLIATVTAASGSPGGSVTFLANDIALATAPLTLFGVATISVPAATLAAGDGTITAVYAGDPVFDESSGTALLHLNLPASGSLVIPFVSPNPVPKAGPYWPYAVSLTEKAGVATTLTSFTVNGVPQNLALWTSTKIPANGTVMANLMATGLTVPMNRTFVFAGRDADGRTWVQSITVPFVPTSGTELVPAIIFSGAPAIVHPDLHGDPACQWRQRLTLQETGGFLVQLVSLVVDSVNLSSKIQPLFGTTRLAPYGVFEADFCWDSLGVTSPKTMQLSGLSEVGTAVTAWVTTSFATASSTPAEFSVSSTALDLPPDGVGSVDLRFAGSNVPWTASVSPSNRTSRWLTLSRSEGSGAGSIVVRSSAAGLSSGVYRAVLSIQAPDAVPPVISVPVTMVVGASSTMSITGVGVDGSSAFAFAPGMQVTVNGAGLASDSLFTTRTPLPFSLAGVSATVNGVSAPIFSVAPDQITLQIPYETGLGTAVLAINNNGQIASYSLPVAVAAPALYSLSIDNTVGARDIARAGDVMTMFFTGAGDLSPSLPTGATPSAATAIRNLPQPRLPVTLTVGGESASILFAGNASGLVGITQINFSLPADLPPGPQPVIVGVGSAKSQPVSLTISPL